MTTTNHQQPPTAQSGLVSTSGIKDRGDTLKLPNSGDELDAFDLLDLRLPKGRYGWTVSTKDGKVYHVIADRDLNVVKGDDWFFRKKNDDGSMTAIVRNLKDIVTYTFTADTVRFVRQVKNK